jgi:hypothetical protein
MEKYNTHLPEYLGGRNIERHSQIIEETDSTVYSNLQLLREWCNIDRPITIQRTATQDTCTYTIRVQTITPLHTFIITGEYSYTANWAEDEVTTEYNYTFNLPNTGGVDMHNFIVTINTYDDVTLSKGYPENDTPNGDMYDHDEFLDRIGALLGLPRKNYISYSLVDAEEAYPPFMGKQVTGGVVQECTEDDYYYAERLHKFTVNFDKQQLAPLMLQLIYGYNDIVEVNSTLLENQQLLDEITLQDPDFLENVSPGCYIFIIPDDNPVNYEDITQAQKKEFIEKYLPITRYAVLANSIRTYLNIRDDSLHPSIIPGSNRDTVYYSTYGVDVRTMGEDERVNVPSQLTYQLDSFTPVLVDYNTTGSTVYTEKRLLSPGVHHVRVGYPATLGYEACTNLYTFKYFLDAYKNLREYHHSFYYFAPYIQQAGMENTFQDTGGGFVYTQTDTNHPDTSDYDWWQVQAPIKNNNDTWIVMEYDVEGFTSTPYRFGTFPGQNQGYTSQSDPTRYLVEPLVGMHRVSVVLPSGDIYVDGRLAQQNREKSHKYWMGKVFLQILRKTARVTIMETRVNQFLPYYQGDGGVYCFDGFLDWQEYSVRAWIDIDTPSVEDVTVFAGTSTSGLDYTLPQLEGGRHSIMVQVVNNKGYLYVDDTEEGVMYDYTTCKQYTYNPAGDNIVYTLVREDTPRLFNNPCDMRIDGDVTIRTVGITPTTLRPEIEHHTPVEQLTLQATPELDTLMHRFVDGYNFHFDVLLDTGGEVVTGIPVQVTVGEHTYTRVNTAGGITVPLHVEDINEDVIRYTLQVNSGRYYKGDSVTGEITITPDDAILFLEYPDLVHGETCTLRAVALQSDGTPITGRYRTIFRVGGKSVNSGGSVAYAYPDSNGVITVEYMVPDNHAGKTQTVQAIIIGGPIAQRGASEIRNVKVK